jgi:hypothetical protein
MTVLRSFLAVLLAGVVLLPAVARAEGAIRFEESKVVGKIQKPEIAILITKQNLTPKYELTLRESFLPKIVESVNSKPF